MRISAHNSYKQNFGIKVSDKMSRNILIQAEPIYGIKGALRLLSYIKKVGGKNGNLEEFEIRRHKDGEVILNYRYNLNDIAKRFTRGEYNYTLEKNEKGFYTFDKFREIGNEIEDDIEKLKQKNNIFNKLKSLLKK